MTSKKLGALLRSVPPATAAVTREEPVEEAPVWTDAPTRPMASATTTAPASRRTSVPAAVEETEVPLQVLIPGHVRKQLAVMAAEQGESLRALTLRAIRSLGIAVTDADIKGKRGRREFLKM